MAVRAPGDYDPNTGWPPDDSTGVNWQNDVELPGSFQGGGAGFGPGGFQGSPRLTAPASGPPPGMSLSNGGGSGASVSPEVIPPTSSPLRPGASPAIRTPGFGPATDATVSKGGGLFSRLSGWLPSLLANPVAAGVGGTAAISAAGWPAEKGRAKLTVDPRIDASGSGGFDVGQPLGAPGGPDSFSPDAGQPTPNYVRPEADVPRTYPSWPTPPAPAPSAQRGMPWADNNGGRPYGVGSPAPAIPPRRVVPRAAGPAAVRQQPNLGTYGGAAPVVANSPFIIFDRPNMTPQNSARDHQGASQMGMLDLSHLFGGGQPTPAAAPIAARPDLAQRVPLGQTPLPVPRPPVDAPLPVPRPRLRSSSSSQGGGY